MLLPITSLLTALAALMLVFLSVNVIRQRMRAGAALGDAGDKRLETAIRAQGNFTEYMPIGLLQVALLELAKFTFWGVVALGLLLMVGRVLHAYSLLNAERYENGKLVGTIVYRQMGMALTFMSLSASALVLLVLTVSA